MSSFREAILWDQLLACIHKLQALPFISLALVAAAGNSLLAPQEEPCALQVPLVDAILPRFDNVITTHP